MGYDWLGGIAHLGERRVCTSEAVGAEPTISTNVFRRCVLELSEIQQKYQTILLACLNGHEPFEISTSRLVQVKDGAILIPPGACPWCQPIQIKSIRHIEPDFEIVVPVVKTSLMP